MANVRLTRWDIPAKHDPLVHIADTGNLNYGPYIWTMCFEKFSGTRLFAEPWFGRTTNSPATCFECLWAQGLRER